MLFGNVAANGTTRARRRFLCHGAPLRILGLEKNSSIADCHFD